MIRIICDSTSDLTPNDNLCEIVSLSIYTKEVKFTDDKDLNISKMMTYLETHNERSGTSCPSTGDWENAFGEENGDEIYVITMSSKLSGTYNSAMIAKSIYEEKYPNSKIYVFDSLSIGPELRLGVEKIMELAFSGIPFEKVCERVEAYLKTTQLFCGLKSVNNMAKNGRINKIVAKSLGIFGINLFGWMTKKGLLEMVDKCRGEKRLIAMLLKKLEEMNYQGGKVRISHVDNPEIAKEIIRELKNKYGEIDAIYYETRGICSYYAERRGFVFGCELQK